MIIKKHISQGRLVLAVCDEEIAGKVFEEGEGILDLSSDFYKGEASSDKEFVALLSKCYIINAAGERAVHILIKENIIEKDGVRTMDGIPYAQVLFESQ